jgi:hypothetical protein
VRIELCDGSGLEPAIQSAVMAEIEAIYESAGIGIIWGEPCAGTPIAPDDFHAASVFIVSKLPNSIRIRFQHFHKNTNVMAYTLPGPGGSAGHIIYISLEKVQANASRSRSIPLTTDQLSRALGRVVAHELAHRFLQEGHGSRGILKNRFNKRDLIDIGALQPYFTPAQVERLRAVSISGNSPPA